MYAVDLILSLAVFINRWRNKFEKVNFAKVYSKMERHDTNEKNMVENRKEVI